VTPEEEDRLIASALVLAQDMREDLAAAHRTVRALERDDLERLAWVLAAAFPIDQPLSSIAWWRFLAKEDAA
jgi:hypothetical protein